MSPAMTVFTVKDSDLYFRPSTACTLLCTRSDTHTHMYNPHRPVTIACSALSNSAEARESVEGVITAELVWVKDTRKRLGESTAQPSAPSSVILQLYL